MTQKAGATDSAYHRQRSIEAFTLASDLVVLEAKGERSDTRAARKRLIAEAWDEMDLARQLAAEERQRGL